jgi:hypothetical protein
MIIYIADYLDRQRQPNRAKRGMQNGWPRIPRGQRLRSTRIAHCWRAPVAFSMLPRPYPISLTPDLSTLYAEASLL